MSLIQNNNNHNWYYPELQGQSIENNPWPNITIPNSGISQLEVNNENGNGSELTKKLLVSCDDMNVVESNKGSQREEESDFSLKTLRSAQMNWGDRPNKVETLQCWKCSYSTTNPISMNRHKLIHQYETRFKCSHCHHTFGEEQIFELHIKTHDKAKEAKDEKSTSSSSSSSTSSSSSASSSASSASLCSPRSQKNKKNEMPILTDSVKEGTKSKKKNPNSTKTKYKKKGETVKGGIRKKSTSRSSANNRNNQGSIITVDLVDDDDDDDREHGEKGEGENEDEEKRREREELEEILHIFDDSDYDSEAERKKKKKKKKLMRLNIKGRRPLSVKKKRASTNSNSTGTGTSNNDNQNQDSNNINNGNVSSGSGDERPLVLTTTRVKGKSWKVKSNSNTTPTPTPASIPFIFPIPEPIPTSDPDAPFRYMCTFPGCSYGCHSTSRFKDHLINHTDQKNFKCNLCDSSFKRKYGLERHQMTVHLVPPQSK